MRLKQFSYESSGDFLQNRRKSSFWPISTLLGLKEVTKICPLGPLFCTFLKVVPVNLENKFHVNQVETCYKITKHLAFDLILDLFGVQRGPGISPSGHILYAHQNYPW